MTLSISSGAFCFLFHKLYVHILWLFFYWGCYFYYPQDSSYIISNMLLVSVASISCNVFYMYIHKWNDTIIYFLLLSLSRITLIIWELIVARLMALTIYTLIQITVISHLHYQWRMTPCKGQGHWVLEWSRPFSWVPMYGVVIICFYICPPPPLDCMSSTWHRCA